MARRVAIGKQSFESIITENCFYIDKTEFIREWWESCDDVTLIMRPRRFGKTLNMSMVEQFFSVDYAGRTDLFEPFSVWQDPRYRSLQGTWPVLFISFADVKETSFRDARQKICHIIKNLYNRYDFLLQGDLLNEDEKCFFRGISADMEEYAATLSLKTLSEYLCRYYGKKVIILMDEYDTPLQESYVDGYWEELAAFIRSLFNSTFKTNPWLERAILTGITRISKESIFSDLNNMEVVTTTSYKYASSFGFTQHEVDAALHEYGLEHTREQVKTWYDGFTFGGLTDIYNPWSIINYLNKRRFEPWWANTSSNTLAGKLIREGSRNIKLSFESLLAGGSLVTQIDEQIVFNQLNDNEQAIWSLLLASGYLKVKRILPPVSGSVNWQQKYELTLTNFEVRLMFCSMVQSWFGSISSEYNDFVKALLVGDVKAMNLYMNRIAISIFSFFDTGKRASSQNPERFYHGFVLGLLVDLDGRYLIRSNRESGFGRYDVCLIPLRQNDDAILMEFKIHDPDDEASLQDTVSAALKQIREKEYAASLLQEGIAPERIRTYGFAFEGKKVLIGSGA